MKQPRAHAVVMLVLAFAGSGCVAAGGESHRARAEDVLTRMVTCFGKPYSHPFFVEQLWQAGNTLETIANLIDASPHPEVARRKWLPEMRAIFNATPTFVDTCNDDFQ